MAYTVFRYFFCSQFNNNAISSFFSTTENISNDWLIFLVILKETKLKIVIKCVSNLKLVKLAMESEVSVKIFEFRLNTNICLFEVMLDSKC